VTARRATRLPAWHAVLLALTGVWIGHVVEHTRVDGLAHLTHGLTHSVHVYMLPFGAALAVLVACAAAAWRRMKVALAHRLEQARDGLAHGLRAGRTGRRARPHAPSEVPSARARWLALSATLCGAQLVLYAVQEGIENAVAGEGYSVLHAFAGAHGTAALIQVGVACALAAIVVACKRRVVELARRIEAVERLAHWLTRARVTPVPVRAGTMRSFTPLERMGLRRLQRPPPRLRISH
jgi:hypothetical protein